MSNKNETIHPQPLQNNDDSDSKRPFLPNDVNNLASMMPMMDKVPDFFDIPNFNSSFSPESRSPKGGIMKLPPLVSNPSSPISLLVKRGFDKNMKLMINSPTTPPETIKLREEEPSLSTNRARSNWIKLRAITLALMVEGNLNEFLEARQRELEKGKSLHEIIIFKPRQLWARFKEFYVNPKGQFLSIWRFFFQVAIIFYSLVFPYKLAFGSEFNDGDALNILTYLTDVYFFLDILMTFFIPLKKHDGSFIYDKKTIALNYIKSSFFLDILTILPFEVFAKKAAFIKVFRIIHLGKFFEYINQFFDLVTPFFVNGLALIKISDFLASITTMFLVMILLIHFCSCIWVSLGFPRYDTEITWFYSIQDLANPNDPNLRKGNSDVYICAMFFVVQTFATIGYGLYTGHTVREYMFSMFLLFMGIVVFTFSYEKMQEVLASFNEADRREKLEEKELGNFCNMIERKVINYKDIVRVDLLSEMEAILNYRVDEDWQKFFIDNEQFKKLNPKAAEKVLEIGLKRFKRKFYMLFQELSDSFVYRTVVQSDSRLFIPHEVIIKGKRHSKGIYLILSGSVLLAGPEKTNAFRRLVSGSFFGEMCITSEKKSPIYYIAETEVNTLFIKREVFLELGKKYPYDIEKLKALAYFRYKHFLFQKHNNTTKEGDSATSGVDNSAQNSERRVNPEQNMQIKTNPAPSDDIASHIDENNEEESPLNANQEKSAAMSDNGNKGLLGFADHLSDGLSFINHEKAKDKQSAHLAFSSTKTFGAQVPENKDSGISNIVKTFKLGAKEYKNIFQIAESHIELAQNSTDSDNSDDDYDDETGKGAPMASENQEKNETESEDNDELNSSDIYPLETKTTFSDHKQIESYVYYLQERLSFLTEELKKGLSEEVYVTTKLTQTWSCETFYV